MFLSLFDVIREIRIDSEIKIAELKFKLSCNRIGIY